MCLVYFRSLTEDIIPDASPFGNTYVYGLMTGLFVWNILTTLSRTYFVHACYAWIIYIYI